MWCPVWCGLVDDLAPADDCCLFIWFTVIRQWFFHSLLLLQEVELQHGHDAHKNLLRAGSVPSLGTSKPAKTKTLLYHNDNDTRSQEALPTISLSAIKCNKVTTITV